MLAERRLLNLVSIFVLLGALAAAAATASGRLPLNAAETVLGLLGLAALLALGSNLGLGVALLPALGAAVPFALGTGTESRLVAALLFALLLLGFWLVQAAVGRDLTLTRSPIVGPTIALMLVWLVSWVASNAVRPPMVRIWPGFPMAQVGGLMVVLVSAGVMLLAARAGREERWIRLATWSLIGVGALATAAHYLRLTSVEALLDTRGVVGLWFVALAAGQVLFNRDLPGWARLGLVGLIVAWLYKAVVTQTGWLSGWLPLLAALAYLTFARSKRAFAGLALLGLAAAAWKFDRLYEAVWVAQVEEGSDTRLEIWLQAWDLLAQYPLFGTGPAGYGVYYMTFYSMSGASMSTHSNFVDVTAQTGLVGAAVFVWFLAALWVVARRACRVWRSGFAAGFAQGARGGLLGVFVAMGLGDWFIPFVYNQTIGGFRYTVQSWVLLGLLAGLAATAPRSEPR